MTTRHQRWTRPFFFAVVGAGAIASALRADIVNPSFEDVRPSPRDPSVMLPTGWNIYVLEEPGYDPWDTAWADTGDYWTGSPIGPSAGQWMGVGFNNAALWQTVSLTAGDQILVDVAVATNASLAGGFAGAMLGWWPDRAAYAEFSVPWDGSFGGASTAWLGWRTLSLTAPATGTYELILQGRFGGNGDGSTTTFFDNIRVVPTPGAGVVVALAGLVSARRRRGRATEVSARRDLRAPGRRERLAPNGVSIDFGT